MLKIQKTKFFSSNLVKKRNFFVNLLELKLLMVWYWFSLSCSFFFSISASVIRITSFKLNLKVAALIGSDFSSKIYLKLGYNKWN